MATLEIVEPKLVSLKQFCKLTGIGYSTAITMCERGEVKHFKTDGGQYRIKMETQTNDTKVKALEEENARLKAIINAISTIAIV